MASELLMEISKDEAERARIRSRKKFEMDMTSNILTAKDNGALEERQKNIKLMHNQLGLSVEVIAKAFGFPEQTVKDILDSQTK